MADEIRLAFAHFRASGKPIYAHSQGIYPSGFVTTTYMLGRAADQFWMQPGASLQVTGVATEDLFFKRCSTSTASSRSTSSATSTRTPSTATSIPTTRRP
jgi:hypothetical protein